MIKGERMTSEQTYTVKTYFESISEPKIDINQTKRQALALEAKFGKDPKIIQVSVNPEK